MKFRCCDRAVSGLFFFLLVLSACGGTETGNPIFESGLPTNPPASGAPTLASERILSSICVKLNACYPGLSTSACQQGVLASSTIDVEIGVAPGFGTYQSIVDAERGGQIQPQEPAAAACISEIDGISCGSAGAQAAYDPSAPGDFTQVFELLSAGTTSCGSVF